MTDVGLGGFLSVIDSFSFKTSLSLAFDSSAKAILVLAIMKTSTTARMIAKPEISISSKEISIPPSSASAVEFNPAAADVERAVVRFADSRYPTVRCVINKTAVVVYIQPMATKRLRDVYTP